MMQNRILPTEDFTSLLHASFNQQNPAVNAWFFSRKVDGDFDNLAILLAKEFNLSSTTNGSIKLTIEEIEDLSISDTSLETQEARNIIVRDMETALPRVEPLGKGSAPDIHLHIEMVTSQQEIGNVDDSTCEEDLMLHHDIADTYGATRLVIPYNNNGMFYAMNRDCKHSQTQFKGHSQLYELRKGASIYKTKIGHPIRFAVDGTAANLPPLVHQRRNKISPIPRLAVKAWLKP